MGVGMNVVRFGVGGSKCAKMDFGQAKLSVGSGPPHTSLSSASLGSNRRAANHNTLNELVKAGSWPEFPARLPPKVGPEGI